MERSKRTRWRGAVLAVIALALAAITHGAELKRRVPGSVTEAKVNPRLALPPVIDPRIVEALPAPRAVQLQNSSLTLTLAGLPAGSRVTPRGARRHPAFSRGCSFVRHPVSMRSTTDSRGLTRFVMPGWFGVRLDSVQFGSNAAATSSTACGVMLDFEIDTPDGKRHSRELSYPDVTLRDSSHQRLQVRRRVSHRVRDTWAWQSRLDFERTAGVGACQGTAPAFGLNRDFEVGVQEFDRDISFRIRTGPIGTLCEFESRPFFGTNGQHALTGMDVRVTDEGTGGCRLLTRRPGFELTRGKVGIAGAIAEADRDFQRGTVRVDTGPLFSDLDQVTTEDQVILADNPRRRLRTVTPSMFLVLECNATLQPSEGGIRVSITNLYFSGPAEVAPAPGPVTR